MSFVIVKADFKPLERCFRYVSEETRRFAVSDALTRSAMTMRVQAQKNIPLQARPLKRGMVTVATSVVPASRGQLSAAVRATDDWTHAWGSRTKLSARQGKSGGSFKPWSSNQTIKGSFKATMKSGYTSLFIRSGVRKRRVGPNRSELPITDIGFGPAVNREMIREDQPTIHAMRRAGQEMFVKRSISNVYRAFKAGKARFGL